MAANDSRWWDLEGGRGGGNGLGIEGAYGAPVNSSPSSPGPPHRQPRRVWALFVLATATFAASKLLHSLRGWSRPQLAHLWEKRQLVRVHTALRSRREKHSCSLRELLPLELLELELELE